VSLVNDMLRDLETRRAAPAEREQLGSLYAVDEAAAARRERHGRMRRGLLVAAAFVVAAVGLFLLSERLRPVAKPPVVSAPVAPAVIEELATPPEVVAATRLLDVLPQNDGRRFVLQLLLDRSVSYQRVDTTGSVSFRLKDVQFTGEARTGRIEKAGQTLSWRVEPQDDDVNVLIIGFGDQLNVADRLESIGDRSQLWLDVSLGSIAEADPQTLSLPVAESPDMHEELPDWVTREVEPAETLNEPARVEPSPEPKAVPRAAVAAEPVAPSAKANLTIGAHQPDPLAQARSALDRGDHLAAIQQLQTLHQAQPDNPEISRWLARAYLSAGDTAALLKWLPAQMQARPFDAELRELLARGQLQLGDQGAAIATLQQSAPPLQRHTAYHALLAALYQQVNDWSASAATYRRLIAVQPGQGAWQLGLAIALEQLDQPAQAGRHYRRALQGQGLDESARRFASERAGSLGGTQ
tara:strand:- start:7798 stop:9201 length:1404 start_codon:yes stop_codon:yes gene_type:complete